MKSWNLQKYNASSISISYLNRKWSCHETLSTEVTHSCSCKPHHLSYLNNISIQIYIIKESEFISYTYKNLHKYSLKSIEQIDQINNSLVVLPSYIHILIIIYNNIKI